MINQDSNTDTMGISNDLLASYLVLISKRPTYIAMNLLYHKTTSHQISSTVVDILMKQLA